MNFTRRKLLEAVLAGPAVALAAVLPSTAMAQAYPTKSIRMIVPFPPSGTTDIIDRLAGETAAAVRHPDVLKRFADIAAEPVSSSPAEQDAMLKKQVAQFRPIIQELGVTLD